MNKERREKYAQELREWQSSHDLEPERRARLARNVDASLQAIKDLIGSIGMIQRDAGIIGVSSVESPEIEARISKNTDGMTDEQRRHFEKSMDLVNAQIGLIGLAERLNQIAAMRPKLENAPAKIIPALIEDRILTELADEKPKDRQRIIDEIFDAAGVQRVTEKTLRSHRKKWRPSKKR